MFDGVAGRHQDDKRLRTDMDFWRLCERGQRPDLITFTSNARIRNTRELTAVLQMDQRDRWPSEQRLLTEKYFEDFPVVCADADCAFDLIYSEYLLQEEHGESPRINDYIARFPQYAARLRSQIDLHRAIHELGYAEQVVSYASETDGLRSKLNLPIASNRLPVIPGYEIQGILGRGAMGIVYEAWQIKLRRRVALKMLLTGEFAHVDLLSRFYTEAEAAARLHHPNIVQIYDLGEHNGLPYLSFELVRGGTLADLLAKGPLEPRDAAAIIATLARAIDFAHQRGIVHRDLKPVNILLSPEDVEKVPRSGRRHGGPASVVKIADFGLAKLTREGHAELTGAGELLGTPNYMSPEQASGQTHQVGPTSDIYALGAILYELLIGHAPFHTLSVVETLQSVLLSEPAGLQRLRPRDLATICTKCLEKDPAKRYGSAGELADDLERFLADLPIRARRITWIEVTWRWHRRNPVTAGLTTLVAALLVTVAGLGVLGSWRLASQLKLTVTAENAERTAKQDAQVKLWNSHLAEANARSMSRRIGQRFESLKAVEKARELLSEIGSTPDRILRLRNAAIFCLALPDLQLVKTFDGIAAGCRNVSPPGTHGLVVFNEANGWISIRRQTDMRELARLNHGIDSGSPPLLSTDGRYLAMDSQDQTRIWRLENGTIHHVVSLPGLHDPTFTPDDGQIALTDSNGAMLLYELAAGKQVRRLGTAAAKGPCAFHKASGRVAIHCQQSIQIISVRTGALLVDLRVRRTDFPALAWHPNGKYLAASSEEGIVLWDVANKKKVITYDHSGHEMQLTFDEHGVYLYSYTTWNGMANLWDAGTGNQVLRLPNFSTWGTGLDAEAKLTLFRVREGSFEVWRYNAADACWFLPLQSAQSDQPHASFSVSPDSRLLAIGCEEGLELWNLAAREQVAKVPLGRSLVHFSDNGDLTAVTPEKSVRWHLRDYPVGDVPVPSADHEFLSVEPDEQLPGVVSTYSIGVSRDGQVLLCQTAHGWSLHHLGDRPRVTHLDTPGDFRVPDVSGDGRWAALGGWGASGVLVFATDTGKLIKQLQVGPLCSIRYSPDGRWLATSPNGLQVWRTDDWSCGLEVNADGAAASGLLFNFSPDSSTLAVLQPDNVIRLFDLQSGHELAQLFEPRMAAAATAFTFSHDATMLLTLSDQEDGAVRIWNLAVLRQELAERQLDWNRPKWSRHD